MLVGGKRRGVIASALLAVLSASLAAPAGASPLPFCPPAVDADCYFLWAMAKNGYIPSNITQKQADHAIGVAKQACSDMLSDTSGGDVPLNWALRYTAGHPELRSETQTVSPQVAMLAQTAATAYCPSVLS